MAEIGVEKKSSIWPWILGLLVLALAIWGMVELLDDDEPEIAEVVAPAAVPVEPGVVPANPPPPEPVAQGPATIADILGNPAGLYGQTWSSSPAGVRVAEVVSDRGFWIEDQGQRLFVVLNESPQPGVADVQGAADQRPARNLNAGDQLMIREGMIQDPTMLQNVAGPIDDQTRQALQGQRVFLTTNIANVQKL